MGDLEFAAADRSDLHRKTPEETRTYAVRLDRLRALPDCRALLEPRLPPALFYNLLVSAKAP